MSAVFDVVREGGPKAIVARARLELLFDPGTFRPIRSNVGDGVVAGSGRVNGRAVCAWAQDGTFRGGSLGAAGAVEALTCVEAVRRGVLPPTVNLEQPDPECDLDHVAGAPREANGIQLALSNSFGFGGQNACLAVTPA